VSQTIAIVLRFREDQARQRHYISHVEVAGMTLG
jgi:hypothetical protein